MAVATRRSRLPRATGSTLCGQTRSPTDLRKAPARGFESDLTHIDGVLRVLAADLDPDTIRPKRAYRRNRYFARSELSRLCLGVLRTAAGEPLSTDDIAGRAIAAKGFDATDSILRGAILDQVGSIVKRLHRGGESENIGTGRASKWKLVSA